MADWMEAWQLREARIDAEMAEREREAEEWEEAQRLEAHARPPNADDFSEPPPASGKPSNTDTGEM